MESPLRAAAPPDLELFETLGFRPDAGFGHLDLHLDRLCTSARVLKIPFDRGAVIRALNAATSDQPARVRLALSLSGRISVTTGPLVATSGPWRLAIAPQRLQAGDPWLGHKTSQRALYNQVRATLPAQVDELLFLNTRGHCCEGSISNLFLADAAGMLVTPPLSDGLLPGVLRRHLIDTGRAKVARLTPADLQAASQIYMGNALRGLIVCDLVPRA